MKCDIIMPVWNQPEITKDCIESIIGNTDYPFRLILIDNGSGQDTEEYLKKIEEGSQCEIELIRNRENLGFIKAVNQGLRISREPYICIMNNDTIATRGWLKDMVDVMNSRSDIGIVNPSSNTSGQFPEEGESIDAYALRLKHHVGNLQELYACRGFCMLIKREAVEKVGLFDEDFGMGYFEETDYSYRAQRAGFKIFRVKSSYVYHREGGSFKDFPEKRLLFEANEKRFFKKWGRPVCMAYFVNSLKSKDRISEIAESAARSGHKVILFLKCGLKSPIEIDHFDIRIHNVNSLFFWPVSLYKVLKRKKKKKIDILMTNDIFGGRFLNMFKRVSGARLVISPDKKNVEELLRTVSSEY